jgi:hypothetical protein
MRPSYTEVEGRLARSFDAFVADIPDHPPVAWSTFSAAPARRNHHRQRILGIAASVVLIFLATVSWASPSAGARYHGAVVLRATTPGISRLDQAHLFRNPSPA